MRLTACLGALLLAASTVVPSHADEAAVKEMIAKYSTAFNAKDLDTVMGFWSESGVHIDRETGERTEGSDAIREDISAVFANRPDMILLGQIERLRFIKPDVASVQGQVSVSAPGEEPTVTNFSAILIGKDGKWMIDTIEESPVPTPATAYDALRDLEWIVGTWTDESEQSSVLNVFRWSENNAFLIRSFTAQLEDGSSHQGTQVIGWDPRSQEIRSWSFNSDGSFGDGTWSKSGEDWLIQSSQTLADGQAASGTYVLSRNGEDEMSWRLIGHEIDGEPQPSRAAVTVIRQSNAPVEASTSSINQ